MIGLDTNILVRLFARDDSDQYEVAVALLDDLPIEEKAVVNIVAVVELLWTLRRVYKFESEQLASVIRRLSEHPKIFLPDRDMLRDATHRSLEEGGDIPDHLVALINRAHGCSGTYTFDENAGRTSDFVLLS